MIVHKSRPNGKLGVLLIVFLSMVGFSSFGRVIGLAVDFLWFKELALSTVFYTSLFAKIGCGVAAGVSVLVVVLVNILVADRMSVRSRRYDTFADAQIIQFFRAMPIERIVLIVGACVVALMIGGMAAGQWETFLKFRSGTPFGTIDPLFGKDVGFYVFTLPLLRVAYFAGVAAVVLSLVGAGALYLIRGSFGFDGRRVLVDAGPRTHTLVLAGLLAVSLYGYFQLQMYAMVTTPGTIVNGAGFSQIKAGLPFIGSLRFLSVAAGLLLWASIFVRIKNPVIIAGGLLLAGVLLSKGATGLVQKFVVGPNELSKETPYINWSIANTRAAYGIETMESKHFVPTADLSADQLKTNDATIANIRLWDHAPLLTTYSQLQEIRTYYEFLDVDNDRYTINGQYRQVMLSPRELVPASLPSRSWINERLTYTHGYGVCVGPVNRVTAEGLPEFFVKNIPPVSTVDITVTRPEIYFGEADAGYAIVKTGAKEFDYPSGNDNIYSVYQGAGGIPLGGIGGKMLFAAYLKELKILFRGDITPDSRILLNRRILDRVKKAAPFLICDDDPYVVITRDGRLVWVVDGYTATSAYPYSAQIAGIGNYMRNSVKAIVDAYTGAITFYAWDEKDPILATYSAIFPGMFKPRAAMPDDIRSHMRYPQTLFTVQAHVYAVYHMTDPQVFYNKEDVWRIPLSNTDGTPMRPYYTIMKLADVGEREEFILMVPFCPSNKENMIAWLAARCDEPNYGKLLVFDFPKQKLVYGPSQIESRINQDTEISKQLTLWNQGGSRVIRGSLLVIPVEQSLIYVQPLYLASQAGGVPELKRVFVAFENRIAMEETLEKSLARIFGISVPGAAEKPQSQATAAQPDAAGPGLAGLVAEANRLFKSAQSQQMQGNWAGYGEEIKQLEKVLAELSAQAR